MFSRYRGQRRPRATNPCSCSALSATSEAALATAATASVVPWAVEATPATLVLISFVVAVCSSTAPATDVCPSLIRVINSAMPSIEAVA